MDSPLSFGASAKFRKILLLRNLEPYTDGIGNIGLPGESEFNYTDYSVIDPGNIEELGDKSERKLKVKNKYSPEGSDYGSVKDINIDQQIETNQGEYEYLSSEPELNSEESQNKMFLLNWYGPESGFNNLINIETIERIVEQRSTYYKFIASRYSPYNILISPNPQGTQGLLSEDSALARIAANSLKTEFQYRVSEELYQQSLGRVNVIDALSDPFDALSIVTGNRDVIEKDWRISVPDNIVGKGLDFISRISGVYSPYSWIPGDYFGEEQKQSFLNQAVNGVGSLFGDRDKPALPENRSSSDIFLANTGQGQSKRLFKNLEFNRFRPDYKKNFINDLNLTAPEGEYYIGSREQELTDVVSPPNELPTNQDGKKYKSAVRGYGLIGELYENGEGTNNFEFGLNGYAYYNKSNSIMGGLVWVSSKRYEEGGQTVGRGGQLVGGVDVSSFRPWDYEKSSSKSYDFKNGSILDDTQKLVDSASDLSGIARLQHVGNAISQISKVFHDGTREITKGSKVIRYEDENGTIVGNEYCRVFTKDTPFLTNSDLQKSDGMTDENRKFSYSVLDKTYNLNIVPYKDEDATNIKEGEVKKYMFSIENLAWRTSNKKGFTYQDLPVSERGPNGGRIMWFPPYEIDFSEDNSVSWTTNSFLGRPEPIFTYNNTTRSGNLSWKIVVDHPSILNAIVDKELSNEDNERVNEIVDSFMAGCRKYDIYELALRFPQFTYKDLYEIITTTEDEITIQEEIKEIPRTETFETVPELETYTEVLEENDWNFGFYFHNDIPGPQSSTAIEADEDYGQTIQHYINIKDLYKSYNETEEQKNQIDLFFQENIENVVTKTNSLVKKIGKVFANEGRVEITLRGSASSPNSNGYNVAISKRRVDSVKDYLLSLKTEEGKPLSEYQNKITFKTETFGENITVQTPSGLLIDCNEELTGTDKIYSLNAIACRRVNIVDVKEIGFEPRVPSDFVPETFEEVVGYDEQVFSSQTVNTTTRTNLQRREEVAKIIVKKLLTERDYFRMMREDSPVVYDGIKEKIKYFHPTFHSTTPEGLNSRLTFLQQCLRPGDTIPVIGDDGKPKESDAINTAFGAPPICVLRIGDFYHTKIAINQLSIRYEPLLFDLNPEGIGVQPMIANITMSFHFIGGQGLKEPVSRLQNALSFNFYANTEVYDERSEVTEKRPKINEEIWKRIEEDSDLGINNRGDENNEVAGDTIGVIEQTTISGDTLSGTTSYTKIMNELIDKTKNYVDTVTNSLETINNEQSEIALYYFSKYRNYKFGQMYNYFNQSEAETTTIFGKPEKIQQQVDTLVENLIADVDDDTSPLLKNIENQNFKRKDIKKFKKNIKSAINKYKTFFTSNFNSSITDIQTALKDWVYVINRINYVTSDSDGYRIKNGRVIVYDIETTTETHETSNAADTKEELINDILQISQDLIDFDERIVNEVDLSVDSLLDSYKLNQNTNYVGFLTGNYDTEEDTRFCTLFLPIITTDPESFKQELLGELSDVDGWELFINNILYGTPYVTTGLEFVLGNEQNNTGLMFQTSGLLKEYLNLKEKSKQKLKNFMESEQVKKYVEYDPYSRDKKRIFNYVKQENANQEQVKNFELTYTEVNAGSPTTFNYKVSFN